jgi:hypothetical protein
MFIPFYSSKKKRSLHRRKGGGRGGGGGGSSSSSGGRGSSGSSGSSRPVSGLPSNSRGTSSYSGGGGSPVTIPAGQAFAGRTLGGGTRGQVFGSRFVFSSRTQSRTQPRLGILTSTLTNGSLAPMAAGILVSVHVQWQVALSRSDFGPLPGA